MTKANYVGARRFRTDEAASSLLKKVFEVSRWATLIQDPSARGTIRNHQAWDSNIAHRTSDFEFFSKLLEHPDE
jgi:hypothetical protein